MTTRIITRTGRLAVLLAAVAVSTPAIAAAAPATTTPAPSVDGIGALAVDAAGAPLTGTAYFKEQVSAGATFTGRIEVSNSGTRYARLHVDPVDAVTSARSGTVFAARSTPRAGLGSWMTVGKSLIRLAPGERRIVSFTVQVPRDARPGDHVGGVAIEPLRQRTTGGQFAVTQVTRVAIATQLTVEGPAGTELAPQILGLANVPSSKVPALTVRLANRGERLCQPRLSARLLQGERLVSAEQRLLDTVLPRTTIDYPVLWPRGLKAGRYVAQVRTSRCGPSLVTETAVDLRDDLSGQTQPAAVGLVPGSIERSAGPHTGRWIGGIIAALAALFAAGWAVARTAATRERQRVLRELRRGHRVT